jgi:hypothetical protein
MDWVEWRDNAQARLDQMVWQGRVANAELDLDRQEALAGQHGAREALAQYNVAHQRLINPKSKKSGKLRLNAWSTTVTFTTRASKRARKMDDGQAVPRRLDDVGMRPRPQRQTRIRTVLHGLQPVGQVPNPENYNNNQINQLSPERVLEREREEAEMAHDDALRAAERLADGDP